MGKLVIKDLHVAIDGSEILKGVNLEVNKGETIALVGPNGHGKSTLLQSIMGHPRIKVLSGSITLDGEDVLAMSVDERARAGLFLGMQYPSEIPGVVNAEFIKAALNAKRKERGEKPVSVIELYSILDKAFNEMNMNIELANRSLNEGFSGGEKKRNEILQMHLLEADINMLDEIDSGLDVDALHDVADQIKKLQAKGKSFIVISHYARLYDMIEPDRVVVILNGISALEGDKEIIEKINRDGYEALAFEHGLTIEKTNEPMSATAIETCGANN
ncbi:MAG: Fe-S cluster assembly ATPase SufC [Erysipelotrichaceae bacterium]|nr:Fe-S cluster assembly ATPase SufC [Erysipelotrichaceae bacterium]